MKHRFALMILGSLITVGGLLAGAHEMSRAQEETPRERSIEGTWLTEVTFVNCETGDPTGAPTFPGLLSFSKGGTMAGTSPMAASVFGVWGRSDGWRNYSFAGVNFRYNSSGALLGRQTVRQTVTLGESGDAFITAGTVEMLDTNGNVVGNGCANSTGIRIE